MSSTIDRPIDATCCPLCHEPNDCVRAAERPDDPCWCDPERFPARLLERIPEAYRRKACVCRSCLGAFGAGSGVRREER